MVSGCVCFLKDIDGLIIDFGIQLTLLIIVFRSLVLNKIMYRWHFARIFKILIWS